MAEEEEGLRRKRMLMTSSYSSGKLEFPSS
jgi:hypothetical protein